MAGRQLARSEVSNTFGFLFISLSIPAGVFAFLKASRVTDDEPLIALVSFVVLIGCIGSASTAVVTTTPRWATSLAHHVHHADEGIALILAVYLSGFGLLRAGGMILLGLALGGGLGYLAAPAAGRH